jgi:ABC-type branched-subunit amino acid transport system permease subunit
MSLWLPLIAGSFLTALIAPILGGMTIRFSENILAAGHDRLRTLFYLFDNLDILGKYDGIHGTPVLNVFGINLEPGRYIFCLIWVAVFGR